MSSERIAMIEQQIVELKARWPAHSTSPELMKQLDELEEQLANALVEEAGSSQNRAPGSPVIFYPVGRVENEITQPAPPDSFAQVVSRIVIDPDLAEGLSGLMAGQKVMVLFWFHRSQGFDLLQHPRGDQTQPKRGVFALRSPRRPNPIGVTVVDLLGLEGNVLTVRGLDAIDGTPVLDIKLE